MKEIEEWKGTYDKKALDILNTIVLNDEQKKELNRCMNEMKPYRKNAFPDIYKLFVGEMSCPEISKYFNRSASTFQYLFENLGIQRSRKDAQEIAGAKRDYGAIRKTFKKTVKKNFIKTQLFGSDIENIVRVELKEYLSELLGDDYEVIVGINSIIKKKELDIPIVIINNDDIYKFGVEVGNTFTHNKDKFVKDKEKIKKFGNDNYTVIALYTKATFYENGHLRNYTHIKNEVKRICEEIKQKILFKELY
ncbi:hypothetical protein [Clostridium botulinum]|uniref:hypothetical protein n=1 Tax=Clostridium botulinum TaxID=1491 RepID=UPI001C9AA977|nr:hypothetical protein [Clostridium botulinum]MBY6809021.1 hypothetical protein [Clostridium botulinum]MBY6822274.1 hypothetical protein [Clostridium botulinum]MBY6832936.1 hypothetical protein [Clostridium botulinum]MBY6972164.1 hypothetical protein [Clostridium botulinum]HBJ1649399.1 hypothetical protein [Clostridium botulinum]